MGRTVEAVVVLAVFFFGGVSMMLLPRAYRSQPLHFTITENPPHLDPDKRILKYLRNRR